MRFQPDEVPAEAVEALRPAYERSSKLTGSPEQWAQRCRDGTAQLWRSDNGRYWAVTEVYEGTAYGKLLHMLASAGDYDDTLREEVEQWGRNEGCQAVITGGRRGWERLFAPHGYQTISITLLKEL